MATGLALEGQVLHLTFPPNVRNTVQDLEREQANPHLLQALRAVLPGLEGLAITVESTAHDRPEDVLRGDPAFQRLLEQTQGEVIEVRVIAR
jgi:DNA polymerase-3 subunit gamma/tau